MHEEPPTVCLDVTAALHQTAGVGRYTRELSRALLRRPASFQWELLAAGARGPDDALDRLAADRASAGPGAPVRLRRIALSVRAWRQLILLSHVVRVPLHPIVGRPAIFHATDVVFPFLAGSAPVATIHDLTFLVAPHWHQPLNRLYLRLASRVMLPRCARLIAVSESTRRDLHRLLGIPAERTSVVYPGVDPYFRPEPGSPSGYAVRARLGLSRPYLLSVGTIEPRKNHGLLLRAFEELLAGDAIPHELVIAGRLGWRYGPFLAAVRASPARERVRLLTIVRDDELPILISGADAFVYPSLYEGFGLPVLEAMACGRPVVTSNVSALPELVGDAALLVDPERPSEIAMAMRAVLSSPDLADRLGRAGAARAATFTWERCARQTQAIYESVADGAPGGPS